MSLLIGTVDQAISPNENVTWTDNRIGGHPIWMHVSSTAYKIPQCLECGCHMTLVTQLYCPLSSLPFHRCIYLFVCATTDCRHRNRWKALRCMKFDESYSKSKENIKKAKNFDNDMWTDDQNDWGDDDADDWGDPEEEDDGGDFEADQVIAEINPYFTSNDEEADSEINHSMDNNSHSPSPVQNPMASCTENLILKSFYMSVFDGYNLTNGSKDEKHISSLISEYEKAEGKQIKDIVHERGSKGESGADSEAYEKTELKHGDKMFHKFLKELQKFPQQCIRYERNGQPLLIRQLDHLESVIPLCPRCRSSRVFELQLVPALIPTLTTIQGESSNIEFGTVLVYTCSKSCPSIDDSSDLDLLEEHVIVQFDPDHHLFC